MKRTALMVGSVPMSLNEMQLAPAIIGAVVRSRGHNYIYRDINMDLYNSVGRSKSKYNECVDQLQDVENSTYNSDVDRWFCDILEVLSSVDVFVVNVFSVLSQNVAYKLIASARKHYPGLQILIGGIGSHRQWFGNVNKYNSKWLEANLHNRSSDIFGQSMLDNLLVDGWQSDTGTTVVESFLPQMPTAINEVVSFDQYQLSDYEWDWNKKHIPFVGSYGCVRRCSFCDVIKSFPKYNYIEADSLTKQIVETVESTGVHTISFKDSLVNGSMSNFLNLLKNLSNAREQGWLPDDFKWSGTYICRSPSPLLSEIHQHLASSGAELLTIGVETGSDKIRYSMDKKFTNKDLLNELDVFTQNGIKAALLFFPGWPTETLEDFNQTLELIDQLLPYSYAGTIDNISFGGSGFILLDGTPIYDERESIGLEPGPTNFLWTCHTNPELTFWESMRRRLLLSYRAMNQGMILDTETEFLSFLLHALKYNYDAIVETHGVPKNTIIPGTTEHFASSVVVRYINSGTQPVSVSFAGATNRINPGIQQIEYLVNARNLVFDIKFPSNYQANIQQYDSGDYYSANGLYIDLFAVDGRDLTFSVFNTMFNETVDYSLPDDYNEHRNERAVIANTILEANVPQTDTLQKYASRLLKPEYFAEIDLITKQIKRRLENLCIRNAE